MITELTDKQLKDVATDIYEACFEAFGDLSDDRCGDHKTKAILSAFALTKEMRCAAADKYGIDQDALPSAWDYVASAYWLHADNGSIGVGVAETVPGCFGADAYLNFARAFSVVQASSAMFHLMMDDGTSSDYIEGVDMSLIS